MISSALRLAALTAGLVLAGAQVSCGHIPVVDKPETAVNPCQGLDWWEVGRTDGAAGLNADKISEYQKRCEPYGIEVDADLYGNGRDAGLIDFCTPTQGIEIGRSGQTYDKVCPVNLEAAFLLGYDRGQKIRKLEKENAEIERRLQDVSNRMNASNGGSAADSLINQLRQKRARNETEISELGSLPQDL